MLKIANIAPGASIVNQRKRKVRLDSDLSLVLSHLPPFPQSVLVTPTLEFRLITSIDTFRHKTDSAKFDENDDDEIRLEIIHYKSKVYFSAQKMAEKMGKLQRQFFLNKMCQL